MHKDLFYPKYLKKKFTKTWNSNFTDGTEVFNIIGAMCLRGTDNIYYNKISHQAQMKLIISSKQSFPGCNKK